MANYAAPQLDGGSVAFDVDGARLSEAGSEEGVLIAEFDLTRTRNWRRVEHSNIWPRPETYGALCDPHTIVLLAQSRIDTISEANRHRSDDLME